MSWNNGFGWDDHSLKGAILGLVPKTIEDKFGHGFFTCHGQDIAFKELPKHHELGLRLLWAVGSFFKPSSVLEIGVRLGYSLGVLMKSSGASVADGWDNQMYIKGSMTLAKENLEKEGLDPTLFIVDSQNRSKLPVDYDLIHVDAGHKLREAEHDICLSVAASPVVVVDDYHPRNHPGVYWAVRRMYQLTGYSLIEFKSEDFGGASFKGCALLVKPHG